MRCVVSELCVGLAMLVAAIAQPAAAEPARTLIGLDTSGSSTFLYQQHSADGAARYVHDHITGLTPPHDLLLVSVGDAGMAKRAIEVRARVTARRAQSPKRMAAQFAGYVAALPGLAAEGRIQADATTSLVEFFQSLEGLCAEAPTRVILFTDAIEWSAAVDGLAFMNGSAGLPAPHAPFLAGCDVEMHGVGQLRQDRASDGLERRLKPVWRDWLTAAGASSIRLTGAFNGF